MAQRWSFHPPKDADRVTINEDQNEYYSRPNSFRTPSAEFLEADVRYNSTASNNPNKRMSLQVPDLVLNLGGSDHDQEVFLDMNRDENTPIIRDRVFYRKPSKYVRPKLSLVKEESDDEVDISTRNSSVKSLVIYDIEDDEDDIAICNTSDRSSLVLHEDED